MFGRSVLLCFLLAIISPVYSAKCNDADQKQIDICAQKHRTAMSIVPKTDDIDAKSQAWWEIQKGLYNCIKPFKCGDFYDTPSSLEGFLILGFTQSVDFSSVNKCIKIKQREEPCYKTLMDKYEEFLKNGVNNAEDKKKYCEILKGAPSCFVEIIKKTENCGDKEVKNFEKKFDDLYKTVKCQ